MAVRIPTEREMSKALSGRIGDELCCRLSKAVVAVCGLGGLGSNISISLARAGVGKLILIDFDHVDLSNLNRQQYKAEQIGMKKTVAMKENLREISPYMDILTYDVRITRENAADLIGEAEIICEAFDKAEEKAMLAEAVLEDMKDNILISASGMAGFSSANDIKTRKITDRFYVCGDGISDSEMEKEGLVSSRVMVCAAHQAHMALRILSGRREP